MHPTYVLPICSTSYTTTLDLYCVMKPVANSLVYSPPFTIKRSTIYIYNHLK